MLTDYLSPQQWRRVGTALDDKLVRSSWMQSTELLGVGITAPILVVLAVLLGSALGLPLGWSQVLATILGLVPVTLYMRRATLCSTQTETDATLFIAQTNPAEAVPSFFEGQDYEGLSGQMANLLSDLTESQVELLIELLVHYQETGDLTQHQWAESQAALDILDEYLPESSDG